MCYDISFSMNIEMITDYIPDLIIDPQIGIEFSDPVFHIQAQDNGKYKIVIPQKDNRLLTPLTWGINLPSGVRTWNAHSEKILNPKSAWYKFKDNRCLLPVTGIYE